MPSKLLKNTVVLLLFSFIFFFSYRPVEFEDIWLHIKLGDFMMSEQGVPHTDPFALSEDPSPWIFHHWLGSVIYSAVFRLSGLLGLKLFRAFLVAGLFLLFFLYARQRVPLPWLLLLLLAMIPGFNQRVFLKPDIFNYYFIQILLILLFAWENNVKRHYLLWITCLGVIWGNIHLGAFIYGNMILGVFFLSQGIAALQKGPRQDDSKKKLGQALLILLTYNAALIINPWGWHGVQHMARIFLDPGCIGLYDINRYVHELRPPQYLLSLDGVWFYILTSGSVACLWFNRRMGLLRLLLFLAAIAAFLCAERVSGLYMMVCGYIIASAFPYLIERWPRQLDASPKAKTGLSFLIIVICLISAFRIHDRKVYLDGQAAREYRLLTAPKGPGHCLAFLQNNNVTGTVFNDERWGGYIIWSAFPELKPFIDGRFLSRRRFSDYIRVFKDPVQNWPAIARGFDITAVLLDTSKPHVLPLVHYLGRHQDWRMVCLQGVTVCFVKKESGDLTDNLTGLVQDLRAAEFPDEQRQNLINSLLWAAPSMPRFDYIDILEEALTLNELGYEDAAFTRFFRAYKLDPGNVSRVLHLNSKK